MKGVMVDKNEQSKVADIIGTLVVMNRGNFVIECGRELQELTEAIKDTGKKGALRQNDILQASAIGNDLQSDVLLGSPTL